MTTTVTLPLPTEDTTTMDDRLGPARGIIVGLAASAIVWAVVAAVWSAVA